jgi:hypothetical protein
MRARSALVLTLVLIIIVAIVGTTVLSAAVGAENAQRVGSSPHPQTE